MTEDEILACAHAGRDFGYGTVVMQAGEDYGTRDRVGGRRHRRIKAETALAVTLSLGERPDDDLRRLARGRGRPLPAALRDLRRGPLPPHPSRLPGRALRPPGPHLRPSRGSATRAGTRRHGRHPGTDVRVGRRRHRALPRPGPGHDRHRPLPRPSGDAARRREFEERRTRADWGRPGAQQRAHDLQGRGPHAAGVPGRQHPQHHRAGHHRPGVRAASSACSAGRTSSCPT